MRQLLIILKGVLIILLVLTVLIWLMSQASSHNIPTKTNIKFGLVAGLLLAFLLVIIYRDKKKES